MSAHDRIPIVPAARALGADPLAAETALAYSLGLVLQPVDRLYVTIDAYQIGIDDRIVLSSDLLVGTNPAAQELLENLGINGVTALRYFNNAIDTRTQGIDVVGSYDVALDSGSLTFTAGYPYNKTERQ